MYFKAILWRVFRDWHHPEVENQLGTTALLAKGNCWTMKAFYPPGTNTPFATSPEAVEPDELHFLGLTKSQILEWGRRKQNLSKTFHSLNVLGKVRETRDSLLSPSWEKKLFPRAEGSLGLEYSGFMM